MAVEGHKII